MVAEVASATGVQMLPLIVGAVEDKSAEEDVPEAEMVEAEVIDPPETVLGETPEAKETSAERST